MVVVSVLSGRLRRIRVAPPSVGSSFTCRWLGESGRRLIADPFGALALMEGEVGGKDGSLLEGCGHVGRIQNVAGEAQQEVGFHGHGLEQVAEESLKIMV